LYFFRFFDFVGLPFVELLDASRAELVGRRMKSIKVAGDGTRTLLFVIVY
jgi:hypothetical protein